MWQKEQHALSVPGFFEHQMPQFLNLKYTRGNALTTGLTYWKADEIATLFKLKCMS